MTDSNSEDRGDISPIANPAEDDVPTHAYVRYLVDNVLRIVKVTDIRAFKPQTLQDFDKKKAYSVWWYDENNMDSDDGEFYKANILLLGTSKSDLEDQTKRRRLILPNKRNMSFASTLTNSSTLEENERQRKRTKKDLNKKNPQNNQNDRILEMNMALQSRDTLKSSTSASEEEKDESFTEKDYFNLKKKLEQYEKSQTFKKQRSGSEKKSKNKSSENENHCSLPNTDERNSLEEHISSLVDDSDNETVIISDSRDSFRKACKTQSQAGPSSEKIYPLERERSPEGQRLKTASLTNLLIKNVNEELSRTKKLLPPRLTRSDSFHPPEHRPVSPKDRLVSPKNRSAPPRNRSVSPRSRSVSPRNRSASPRNRSVSPKNRSVSPRSRSVSPRNRSASPRNRSVSPKNRSVSPRSRSVSPRNRSASPRNRSVSSRSRSVSSRSRSVSSRSRSVSSRSRSVSPRSRSISPRNRSVSPRNRLVSSPEGRSLSHQQQRLISDPENKSVLDEENRSASNRERRPVSHSEIQTPEFRRDDLEPNSSSQRLSASEYVEKAITTKKEFPIAADNPEMICLDEDHKIREDVWELMQRKNDSKFVKNLMDHLWPGKLSAKYFDKNDKRIKKDRNPGVTRTPLSPKKIEIIYDALHHKISRTNKVSGAKLRTRLNDTRTYITQKISDEIEAAKRRS